MKYLAVVIIWAALVALNVLGFVVALAALPFNRRYTERVMKAHNRAAAAVLGFSGTHGISHECGLIEHRCRLCRWLCRVLSLLLDDKGHCQKEASS